MLNLGVFFCTLLTQSQTEKYLQDRTKTYNQGANILIAAWCSSKASTICRLSSISWATAEGSIGGGVGFHFHTPLPPESAAPERAAPVGPVARGYKNAMKSCVFGSSGHLGVSKQKDEGKMKMEVACVYVDDFGVVHKFPNFLKGY